MSNKSYLNEYCQKKRLDYPKYVPEKAGDLYVCRVWVDGEEYRSIEGHSTKKDAEQDAAKVVVSNLVQMHREARNVQELLACAEREGKSEGVRRSFSEPWGSGTKGGLVCYEPQNKVPEEPESLPSTPAAIVPQPPQVVPSSSALTPNQSNSVEPPERPLQAVPASAIRLAQTSTFQSHQSPPQNLPSSLFAGAQPSQTVPNHAIPAFSSLPPPSSPESDGSVHQSPPTISLSLQHPASSPTTPVKPDRPSKEFSPSSQSPGTPSPLLFQQLLSSPGLSSSAAGSCGRGFVRSQSTPQPGRQVSSLAINFPRQSPPTSSVPTVNTTPRISQPPSVGLNPNSVPFRPPTISPMVVPIRAHLHPRPPAPLVVNSPSNPPPNNLVNFSNSVEPTYDFVKTLVSYCNKCSFNSPIYSITETKKRYVAVVYVGSLQFRGTQSLESFDAAKEHVALVALACLGIRALGLDDAAPCVTSTALPPHPVHSLPVRVQSRGTSEDTSDSSGSLSEVPTSGAAALPSTAAAVEASLPLPGPLSGSPDLPSKDSKLAAPRLHPPSFYKESSPSDTPAVPVPPHSNPSPSTVSQAVLDLMAAENYKTALNTYCQQNHLTPPKYDCTYPEDEVGYIVVIRVDGKTFKSTPQGTKRGAESMAASLALKGLGISVSRNGTDHVGNGENHGGALHQPPQIEEADRNVSYKNLLQEYFQKSNSSLPVYRTEREEGAYISIVSVKLPPDGKSRSFRGKPHANKKAAEQESAKKACLELGVVRA